MLKKLIVNKIALVPPVKFSFGSWKKKRTQNGSRLYLNMVVLIKFNGPVYLCSLGYYWLYKHSLYLKERKKKRVQFKYTNQTKVPPQKLQNLQEGLKLESAQPSTQISISEQKIMLLWLSSTSSNVGLPIHTHYMRERDRAFQILLLQCPLNLPVQLDCDFYWG